jgi:hypothetical protein
MSMGCSWVPRCVATAKNLREVVRLVEVVTVKVTCGRAGRGEGRDEGRGAGRGEGGDGWGRSRIAKE